MGRNKRKQKKEIADEEPVEIAEEKERKPQKVVRRDKNNDQPKDSTRWFPILFLILFLFVSYLFWAR